MGPKDKKRGEKKMEVKNMGRKETGGKERQFSVVDGLVK